jgi:hypothetical protein
MNLTEAYRMRTGGLLICLWLFSLIAVQAAEIQVSSGVDQSEITIGDKIKYRITVQFPETGTLELPSVLGNLGSFEVKDYEVSDPVETETGREQTWEFTLSTFTVGEYTLPPQIIEYTPEDDTVKQVLYTEPIVITVKRTTAETVKDIADITGLAAIRGGWSGVWIFGIIAFLAGNALFFWYYFKKRKLSKRPPPPKPPYEEAVELLTALKNKNLPDSGLCKEYCFALSEILRHYITRRFAIDAMESTTEEFLEKIQGIGLTLAQKTTIAEFCSTTDPVKFADVTLSSEEAARVYEQVEALVYQTRPRVIEEPGAKNPEPKAGS